MQKNITGQKFGKLTAVSFSHHNEKRQSFWRFKCDCGNEHVAQGYQVTSGKTKSCGCLTHDRATFFIQHLIGKKFGRIFVSSFSGRDKHGFIKLNCVCDCGSQITVLYQSLRDNLTKSCGCLLRESACARGKLQFTHGLTRKDAIHPIFRRWSNMMERCYRQSNKSWGNYGARGIIVCKRWHSFSNFSEDMLESFNQHALIFGDGRFTQLDRIDNNGDYEPSNCRWTTPKTQSLNRRSNVLVTFKKETKPLKEWCSEFSIPYATLYNRYVVKQWPIEKALTTPVKGRY